MLGKMMKLSKYIAENIDIYDPNNMEKNIEELLNQKNYNIDSESAISEANSNLDSALNQIREYALSKTPIATTGTTYSNLSAKLPTYDAVAPIRSTLDNQQNYSAANKFIADASKVGTGGAGNTLATTGFQDGSMLNMIKKKLTTKDDPNQYYLNRA